MMLNILAKASLGAIAVMVVVTLGSLMIQPAPVFADIADGIVGGSDDAAGTTQQKTSLFGVNGQGGVFRTITNILLFLVGAVAVIMIVIGGLRYVTSNGDQQAVTNAKNTILYAIVGIVVAFLAYAAVNFVGQQITGSTTTTNQGDGAGG